MIFVTIPILSIRSKHSIPSSMIKQDVMSSAGNDAADELARRGAQFMPSAISCSLSSFISRIISCLLSDWRCTVSLKFFNTQVPSVYTEELVLPRHARCALSRLCCNGQNVLLSFYLSRIGRIKNHPCSACGHLFQDTPHLILHCPATDSLRRLILGDSLSLYNFWSWSRRAARFLGDYGLPPCPISRKGSGNNSNNKTTTGDCHNRFDYVTMTSKSKIVFQKSYF